MKWTDLKYFAAFIIPLLVFIGIYLGGPLTFSGVVFAFVFIPLIEPWFSSDTKGFTASEKLDRRASLFFDTLLFLNIPIVYGAVIYFGIKSNAGAFSTMEILGLVLSIGTCLGACGINVAHELGHRHNRIHQFLAKVLLLPSLYLHFFIEHNRGHHLNVATPDDPATARIHESVYAFWWRSVTGSYINAWRLEQKRINTTLSLENMMIVYTLITMTYVITLFSFFTPLTVLLILSIGLVSFLLLETINYIEHYGLRRRKKENGRYERVLAKHSWNSNHLFGRIVLYELTRHSDHHFIASKEYQILEHHADSPQLPFGYPSSMLMALIPPLWFKIMNPKVELLS